MIPAQSLITLFEQALKEKWGYIWGTAGEVWTAAKQKELEKTTDEDRAQGRKYGDRWISHRVADCSGLFSWAFKQLGGYMYHGSDTMYRKYCVSKGELKNGKRTDSATLKPGTAVFVWNGKKYSHVGLYAGDGTVIEAMGTIAGVTTTRVTLGKWTHWGELSGVDYNAGNEQLIMNNEKLTERETVRRGSKGQAVEEMQRMLLKLGYDLGPCRVDGDFGKATETAIRSFQSDHQLVVDGICGLATYAELERAVSVLAGKPVERTYTVTITGLTREKAEEIAGQYGGVLAEE